MQDLSCEHLGAGPSGKCWSAVSRASLGSCCTEGLLPSAEQAERATLAQGGGDENCDLKKKKKRASQASGVKTRSYKVRSSLLTDLASSLAGTGAETDIQGGCRLAPRPLPARSQLLTVHVP